MADGGKCELPTQVKDARPLPPLASTFRKRKHSFKSCACDFEVDFYILDVFLLCFFNCFLHLLMFFTLFIIFCVCFCHF